MPSETSTAIWEVETALGQLDPADTAELVRLTMRLAELCRVMATQIKTAQQVANSAGNLASCLANGVLPD